MSDKPRAPRVSAGPALPRVTIFITRDAAMERELLLVQSPERGLSLPDAAVDPDETSEETALRLARSVYEQGATVAKILDVVTETLEADKRIVLRPQFLRTAPQSDATLMRFMLERGANVQAHEIQNGYTRIVYEEYALTDGDFAITTRRAGWIATNALCGCVEHTLIHLHAPTDPIQAAQPHATSKADVVTSWVGLSHVAGLQSEHQGWLERVRAALQDE